MILKTNFLSEISLFNLKQFYFYFKDHLFRQPTN